LARLTAELRARYPKMQWATYDAVSDENRLAGLRSASGRDVDLMLRLDRAAVILSLDADPLITGFASRAVRSPHSWRRSRRASAPPERAPSSPGPGSAP